MSKKTDVPVLTDVVKRGDEDVIKAARLEREIFDELNRMAPREHLISASATRARDPAPPAEGDLEHAIDQIIEAHSNAMRYELLKLLRDRLR